jgi:hypothetical protein
VRIAIVVLVTLVGCGNLAFADMAAIVNPSDITGTNGAGRLAIGWRFFAEKEFTITHLGLFDYGDDGLSTTHTLGIWRVNKDGGLALIRQADIGSSMGTFQDHYRFVDIDDFTIAPDPVPWINPSTGLPYIDPSTGLPYYERWVVGVWSPDNSLDAVILQPPSVATILAESTGFIRMESQLSRFSDEFTYPWANVSGEDHFGVNFLYTPVPVPAPGALVLALIGLTYASRRLRSR